MSHPTPAVHYMHAESIEPGQLVHEPGSGQSTPRTYFEVLRVTRDPNGTGRLVAHAADGSLRSRFIDGLVEVLDADDPQARHCDACDSLPGEPCDPFCIGLAWAADQQ